MYADKSTNTGSRDEIINLSDAPTETGTMYQGTRPGYRAPGHIVKELGEPMRLVFGDMTGVFILCWIPVIFAFFFPWSVFIRNVTVVGDLDSHQLALALTIGIFPWIVLVLHVWKGRLWDGILDMILWALWECLIMIALCYLYPDRAQEIIFRASDYWDEMSRWIASGKGAEGDIAQWGMIHAKHLGMLVIAGFLFGLPALIFGVLQLNYMNFYVAQLMSASDNPLLTLVVAWHFWSILRVVGYIILASTMFQIFMALIIRRPSRNYAIAGGFIWGILFVIADATCKYVYAENVRQWLFDNVRL